MWRHTRTFWEADQKQTTAPENRDTWQPTDWLPGYTAHSSGISALADLRGGLRELQPPLWSEIFTPKRLFFAIFSSATPLLDRMVDKNSHERLQPPPLNISRFAYDQSVKTFFDTLFVSNKLLKQRYENGQIRFVCLMITDKCLLPETTDDPYCKFNQILKMAYLSKCCMTFF